MASGGQQLRLLLWKDYLLRKRKPITVGGVIWAAAALISLVIVRKNVDPIEKPTCEFSARALPSAGVASFLQSFLCTLSNQCDTLEKYQEIPDYRHTRLKQYQEQFLPVFQVAQVQEVLQALPGAGRLLATITRAIDTPQLHRIVQYGLKVSDLFKNPEDVKDILVSEIKVKRSALDTFVDSNLKFETIVKEVSSSQKLSCEADTLKNFFNSTNEEDIELVLSKFCAINPKDMENIIKHLAMEIDLKKFLKIIGEVLNKLTGSNSVSNLGDMLDAMLRLSSIENYVPKELQFHKWLPSIMGEAKKIKFTDFSYVDMNIAYRLLNLFEPLFKNSEFYKKLYNALEVLSSTFTTLQSLLDNKVEHRHPQSNMTHTESVGSTLRILLESDKGGENLTDNFYKLSKKVELFTMTVKSVLRDGSLGNANPTEIMISISQFIMDALPKKTQHDTFFYLTLLNRLVVGGLQSARLHLDMEHILLGACRRHPQGVQLIGKLGPDTVARIVDGFSDADRIQAFTGKVFHPGQMFCDLTRIQTLLKMSRQQALGVKPHLCNNVWKAFVIDVIDSFGVYNASKTINSLASLVVSETLGHSVESQFVTVGEVVGNMSALTTFIRDAVLDDVEPESTPVDWESVFNISNFKEIKDVVQKKLNSSKLILVTIHTALAKEVITSNRILDTYISPIIAKLSSALSALSQQMDTIPKDLMKSIEKYFITLSELVLATLNDKDRTINVLLSDHKEVFCGMVSNCTTEPDNCEESLDQNKYVVFPSDADKLKISTLLCNLSTSVADKLQADFSSDKLLMLVKSLITDETKEKHVTVNWNQLIKVMQQLYSKMEERFGFVFRLNLVKEDDVWSNARILADRMWQSDLFNGNAAGAMQLSGSLFSRLLDLFDNRVFGFQENPEWPKVKTKADSVNSMLYLLNQFSEMLSAFILRDKYYKIEELPITSRNSTILALNFSPLIRDVATFIASKKDISSLASVFNSTPAWPCDPVGLGPALGLGPLAAEALKAAEALMCAPTEMQMEWEKFTHFQKLQAINTNATVDLPYSEHIFLKVGRNFVSFVENLEELSGTANSVYGDNKVFSTSEEFSILSAWKDAVKIIEDNNQNNTIVKNILTNMDRLMSIGTKNVTSSPAILWETAFACGKISDNNTTMSKDECRAIYWSAVKYSVRCIAEAGQQLVNDLTEYFSEISEPNANALQLIGFTRKTGPYLIFSKLPQFIHVLMNSFLDQGFMKQVTQASDRRFWDCERLVDSLKIPSSISVTHQEIQLVKPYICPSLIHWVSVPTDENVLFDLLAKSQFIFFNKPVSNYTANFTHLYESSLKLKDVMSNVDQNKTKNQYPLWDNEWLDKFKNIAYTLISKNGKNISTAEILNSTYINDGFNVVYLSKISQIVYEISFNLNELRNASNPELQDAEIITDFRLFMKLLNRKSKEMIEIFVYAVTEKLKNSLDYQTFDLLESLDLFCKDESKWSKDVMIFQTNPKNIKQFCKSNYRKYIQLVEKNMAEKNRKSFNDIVKNFFERLVTMEAVYKSEMNLTSWKDIFNHLLKWNSPQPAEQLKSSLSYTRELGLRGFLHYQQSRVQFFSIVLDFISGDDWWSSLRSQLKGDHAQLMMDLVEASPDILDDIVTNMAKLKIVRLVKDIKTNSTELLCALNISEYIPDKTGLLTKLKTSLCQFNKTALFMEITPFRLAGMIYEDSLEITEEVNTTSLNANIEDFQTKLRSLIETGVKRATLPSWITTEHLDNFYSFDLRMSRESTIIDIAFLLLNNVIDASTLFVNSTSSPISSALTPWVKQVNLQLIKADEYANFVCELPMLNLEEIHNELLETFHWDLALGEVVSGRNYTWTELNKSLNQLLDIARHYSQDSLRGKMDRVTQCLLNSTDSQPINRAAMYITLGSRVMKLIQAMIPHFKEVVGFPSSPVMKQLSAILNETVAVLVPLEKVVANMTMLRNELNDVTSEKQTVDEIVKVDIDLNKVSSPYYNIFDNELSQIIENIALQIPDAEQHQIMKILLKHLSQDYIKKNLADLRSKSFWSLSWLQKIVQSVEGLLYHSGQLLGSLSGVNWDGLMRGEPIATIDLMLSVLQEDFVTAIVYRLNGIIEELHPLLSNLNIEQDLVSTSRGIQSVIAFRNELVESLDLRLKISELFRDWDDLKPQIQNETILTPLLLDELQNGTLDVAAMLTPNSGSSHIHELVCGPGLGRLIQFQSAKIALADVSKQICRLTNTQIKKMASTLMQKINFTYVFDIVINGTVRQVMKASDLTEEEGAKIVQTLGQAASLLPTFQEVLSNVSDVMKSEPLLQSFQGGGGITDLLANKDFLADAGNMACGKPFYTNTNRFYKAITELKDNNAGPDQDQLDSLPTDYCRDMHKEILKMGGGKILWSYAKPLLMGKILYTPDTPQAREIIVAANSSFSQVGQVTTLLKQLAEGFSSLEEITLHKASLATMQKLAQSPLVQDALAKVTSDDSKLDISSLDLNDLISQFGDTATMKALVTKFSQMTDCISLDRFVPVATEALLEQKAGKLMILNEFLAGVVFMDNNNRSINTKTSANVEYKIRMDIDNVPSTSRIKNQFWAPGPDADFIDNLRYFRGFVQLQDLIDKAIISTRLTSANPSSPVTSPAGVVKRDASWAVGLDVAINDSRVEDWAVYTQQMPYACWVKDDFQTTMYESQALIVAFFFCLILTVSSIVRNMVWERESGNTSLMCVMGMKRQLHTLSWAIASLLEVLLTMLVLCAVLKWGGILPNTDAGLLLLVLLNFGLSIVMFCYMISAMFRSASLGAVSAAILYLLSYMPFIIIIAMEAELTLSQKMLASLSMSSGFSYGLLQTARYEVQGSGLRWDNVWGSPTARDNMSISLSCFVVLFDSLLYGMIGWAINSVCFRNNITTGVIGSGSDKPSKEVGVRIEGLSKVYGRSNSAALSHVSMDLLRGHITTLLGHNGAGKTTLIKILTGMIKPTAGKIIINKQQSPNQKEDLTYKIKNHIGLCPQFDVLLEVMSAREHLTYYAQLKTGLPSSDVKHEVDSMLDALGLGPLSVEPVYRLSGGLRRRLCVGLAFIADPHLVVLDEPSSGVDPVARRDIWSMILGLKAQRTILLTTHHLDEAEILSDTVIIMHKGQVHASGTPLSLKHRYGEGYKLTVTYPLSQSFITGQTKLFRDNETNGNIVLPKKNGSIGSINITMNGGKAINGSNATNGSGNHIGDGVLEVNHSVKDLMEVVRSVVANSKVTDVTRHEVEVQLPFLDDKGLNNDFLALTESLESKQSDLKFSSLSMDCSTLEQVFLTLCGKKGELEGKGEVHMDTDHEIEGDNKKWEPENSDSESDLESGFNSTPPSFLPLLQFLALLHKRLLHYVRSPRLLAAALLLPTVFVAMAMGFSLIRPPPDSHTPVRLDHTLYGGHSAEFASFPDPSQHPFLEPGDEVIQRLIQMSMQSGNRTSKIWIENERQCECLNGWQHCEENLDTSLRNSTAPENQIIVLPSMKELVHWIVDSQNQYIEKRYGGWSLAHLQLNETSSTSPAQFVVWYNNKGQHSLPAYLNALSNAVLQAGGGGGNITTYSHPLKLSAEQLSKSTLLQHVADVGISVVLLIGFSLVPAVSAVFLVGERTSQQKRLQLLSSVHPVTYWMASLVWDVVIIIAAIILSIIVFQIFGLPVYVSRDNLTAVCFLLLLYGVSSSSLVHLLEKLFNEASLANMVIFCTNVFVAVIGLTILLIIDVVTTSDMAQDVRKVLHKLFLIWPGFALGDGLVQISRNSIQADLLERFGLDTYVSPVSWELLGPHMLALCATTLVFVALNVAIEMRLFDWLLEKFFKSDIPPTDLDTEDCDVATERYRVELATLKAYYNMDYAGDNNKAEGGGGGGGPGEVEKDTLQVVGLVKQYRAVLGDRVAVNNVTFGVKRGQCFGLLGVNGAGKSTTFSMLTGELRPTGGCIYVRGQKVSQRDICNGDIAYCPQNDALDPLLTLTEHLQFYCRIRGIKNSGKRIRNILRELEIERYSHQRAGTLSGGNKRKLCLAIALLSDATLLLLDEPTSGMDPGARQRAGVAMTKAAQSGKALLLSSHSLLECEALCSVAGLMWGGRLLALGPPARLKARYGGGHLVRLVSPAAPLTLARSHWPTCRLLALHPPCLQLLLPPPCPLSQVWRGIAAISTQVTIKDFSINQSSLDQVFINLSNSQEEEITSDKSGPGIRLSTLERQYSQRTQMDSPTNIMTKF